MDSLYLLQFACLIFMLINALILGISRLHVQWLNKRYEQSRWMIFAAMIGLGIQYALQMYFGFRAMGEDIGTIINLLVYTPCFTLIAMGIYNVETTESNRKNESGLLLFLCSHHRCLRSQFLSKGWMAHRSLDLCTADPFHGQCGVLHIYDSCTDTQEKKDAGNDGCYRYAAIRKIYSCWRIAPLLQRSGHTFCNALNHLIIYSRTFWTDNCDLFQSQLCCSCQ